MEQINILVVDDEKEIADLVEIYLVSDGYKVFKANNAKEGLEILDQEEIHLVLLDIMMPGMDGLEMCRKIRETNNIPIIMLSAKSTDLDKILGLGTGADDYVVKPFNPLELTARVKSQLRRYTQLNPNSSTGKAAKNEISSRGLSINKDNHKVVVYGEEIKLTPSSSISCTFWHRIPAGCSAPTRSLRRYGTRKYTRQTTPSWYISGDSAEK